METTTFVSIFLAALLTDNFVLSRFLGICPFLGVSKKLDTALGMSIAVTFVMLIATLLTWPIQTFVLTPNDLGYLQTLVFVLIIATFVQFVSIILQKFFVGIYNALGIFLPLMTTNCAILGVVILNIGDDFTYFESIINCLGAGLGFLLAMVLFAGIRERLETCPIPKSLQGLPITLIAAALISIVFLGFSGLAN